MWGKRRPFGVDKDALQRELDRRTVAHRAAMDQGNREIEQLRQEQLLLQAEESELADLEQRLRASQPPAAPEIPARQGSATAELSALVTALQRMEGEALHLRSTRARLLEQLRHALFPFLQRRANTTDPQKEDAHV